MRHTKELYRYRQNLGLLATQYPTAPSCVTGGVKASTTGHMFRPCGTPVCVVPLDESRGHPHEL